MNPSKIYPACSLMLVNQDYEFLMLKRSPSAKFMPNFWVFGGGKVEQNDEILWHQLSLQQQERFKANINTQALGISDLQVSLLWANAIACLRETWEEAGILVPGCPSALIELWQGQCQVLDSQALAQLLEVLLLKLSYTDHWVTPEDYPVRFDTLFFMTLIDQSLAVSIDQKEIVDWAWWKPSLLLNAYENHHLELGAPTIRLLHDLAQYEAMLMMDQGNALKNKSIKAVIEQRRQNQLNSNPTICPKAFRDKQHTILLFPKDQAFEQGHTLASLLEAQSKPMDRLVLEGQRLRRYID